MQARLREPGCDIEWLMTGKTPSDRTTDKQPDLITEFTLPGHISEEKRRQIQKMIHDLNEMPTEDIERAREIVKAAFRNI